jgi:hypothetical protein
MGNKQWKVNPPEREVGTAYQFTQDCRWKINIQKSIVMTSSNNLKVKKV